MAGKLSAAKVKTADKGRYGDGDGLWLRKSAKDRGKWVLLYRLHGRRREMGLGAYPATSLAEAREHASTWRGFVRQGIDPVAERERQQKEAERNLHSFEDVALDCFESLKADLKGDGKNGRWFSPIKLHVIPKLGERPITEIDQIDIRDALAPIWHEKPDVARKAMNRINKIFKHSVALGLDADLQAPSKAKILLGKRRHKEQHIPSLPWAEVPDFYASLTDQTSTHLALRLLILTGVRSRPIRFAHLDQIDGDVWTIPADLMKGTEGASSDFRVPLSDAALAVIEAAKPLARDGYLFPSVRKGVISDMTMSQYMKRQGMEARPHGFRSSLREWIEQPEEGDTLLQPKAPYEVAETILAHTVGGKVERAYRRSDYLEQRRVVMQRWADFVTGQQAAPARPVTTEEKIAALDVQIAQHKAEIAKLEAERAGLIVARVQRNATDGNVIRLAR